jgi:hypothetical protein
MDIEKLSRKSFFVQNDEQGKINKIEKEIN